MIKYKYLPFTHNKPRYQHVDQSKWQLKAQMLSPSSPSAAIISSNDDENAADREPLIVTATIPNNITDI